MVSEPLSSGLQEDLRQRLRLRQSSHRRQHSFFVSHCAVYTGSLLYGRRLWHYVTGDIPKPVLRPVTDSDSSDDNFVANTVILVDDFEARLEEWESIQCKILSWFINTSVPAISSLLPRLETGQEQLAVADPSLKYVEDIDLFAKYKDPRRSTQFMMGLCEDFEPTRAALLSRSPLPSLDAVVKELISEENRRPHHHLSSSDVVLVTPHLPASSFDRPHRICKYCKKPGHNISECY
uniref:CCHC-type domain-containing protein n=1 Tax=Fagus sylvatica TaxID=28930 RepID=A0A2N9J6S7_FAGSY